MLMNWVLRLRLPIILLSFFILFYFGHLGNSLETESSASISNILAEDDPSIVENEKFEEIFGSNESIVVALETDNVYHNPFLAFLIRLTEELESIEGVRDVHGLAATLTDIRGEADELLTERFVTEEDLPYSAGQLSRMKQRFSGHPFLQNRFIDQAGKATLISVRIDTEMMTEDSQKEQLAALIAAATTDAIAEETKKGSLRITPHFAGSAVVGSQIREMQRTEDYIKLVMLIVLAAVLLIAFRTFYGVAVPLLIAMTSMSFVMGLKALFHSTFSTIDPMLYALIFTISVGDSIHVIAAWYGPEHAAIADKKQRILRIMQHVLMPCCLTSVTTAVGFSAVATSSIPELRKFGFFAAVAVVFAFVLTIALVPALLTLFESPSLLAKWTRRKAGPSIEPPLPRIRDDAITDVLVRLTHAHPRAILVSFAIAGAISVIGILRIHVGTDPYSFMMDTHPVNVALRFIEENVCGIQDLEVVLEADRDDEPFKDPALLREVEAFQRHVESFEGVTQGNSILAFVKLLNRAMHDNESARHALPETRALTAQYLLLYESSGNAESLGDWVSLPYDKLRMNFKVADDGDFELIRDQIEEYARKRELPFGYQITGSAELWYRADRVFLRSQLLSLLLALSVISIILFLVFRSVRYGVYSMAVNLFPILVGLGYLGFSGTGLNMGTVMIAPIAIGIAVDDAIHFLTRYRNLVDVESTSETRLRRVFRTVARPIIFTSVVLAIGFGSNSISAFKPNAYFGLVSALTLLVAMFANLLLLPAMLVVRPPRPSRRPYASPNALPEP
jgi:predicted RND superfamily exporter protein